MWILLNVLVALVAFHGVKSGGGVIESNVIDDHHNFVPHENDCSKYYENFHTVDTDGLTSIVKSQERQCGFGTFWSQDVLTCVEWVHASCQANICAGQADMTKFVYLGCDTYWNCMGGVPIATRCQAGHIFNDATKSCISDSTNPCFAAIAYQCNLMEDTNDATKYYVTLQDGSNIHMSCSPGTAYDSSDCGCTALSGNVVVTSSVCTALIEHENGDQFTWKQTEELYVGNYGASFQSNKIVFSPSAHIVIWRSAQYEFKNSFAATMTIELPAFSGVGTNGEQILINSIYSSPPSGSVTNAGSISLQVIRNTGSNMYLGQIVTEIGTQTVTVIQTSRLTDPTSIIFAYDGTTVALKVVSQESSAALTGNIKTSQSGITLARGVEPGSMPFEGSISNLKIYDCISQDVANNLNAI